MFDSNSCIKNIKTIISGQKIIKANRKVDQDRKQDET